MQGNPYSKLLQTIRDDMLGRFPVAYRFGTVISANPVKVNVEGTIQDSDSLLKNSQLEALTAGEKLLLLPIEEEQRYIIICKVVDI